MTTAAIAIVAADASTALAPDLAGTWKGLVEGRRPVAPSGAAESAAPPLPPTSVAVVTPHGVLLERLARSVHAAAGGSELPREQVGFHVGLGMVDSEPDAFAAAIAASRDTEGRFDLGRFFGDAFRSVHPHWPLRMLNNVAVGQVAAELDLRGDNLVVSAEADAGARAVAEAVAAIRSGAVRASVVAGVGEAASPSARLRARFRGTPELVLGEGGGALFLEDEASAQGRGRLPIGRLLGCGFAFESRPGGGGTTGEALARAARQALAEAGATAAQVGCVLVDEPPSVVETALSSLFRARTPDVAVVASAAVLGHLLAGAPVAAVALATAMHASGALPAGSGGARRGRPTSATSLVLASGSAGGAAALLVGGPA